MTSADSTAFFTRTWSLYDHIAEHNYMYHREIHAAIARLLKRRREQGPYQLLDLGCGNGRFMAPCLKQALPTRYEGVDLSEAALEEARGYLAGLDCEVVLRHGDLLEAAETTDQRWDVIYSGFALHHLSAADKTRFFRAVERSLTDDGWLLLVDVVREENQSREDYLKDYLRLMRGEWTKMPRDQLETACEHVATHDYPEDISTLKAMAGNAGLKASRVFSRHGAHCGMMFSRGEVGPGNNK